MNPDASVALTFQSLSKHYVTGNWLRGKKVKNALREIDCLVSSKCILGVAGVNGAGKSTFIKLACGILKPSLGHVTVLGLDPSKSRHELLPKIGLVMGARSRLIWDLPLIQSFRLHKAIYGISTIDFERNFSELDQWFNIASLQDQVVRNLSHGQRMRMDIALSCLHRPQMLFLDEPTIALDNETQKSVRNFLTKINQEWETTVILASNDLDDISAVCSEILLLNNTRTLFHGPISELYRLMGSKRLIELTYNSPNDANRIKLELSRFGVFQFTDDHANMRLSSSIDPIAFPKVCQSLLGIIGKDNLKSISAGTPSLAEIIKDISRDDFHPRT